MAFMCYTVVPQGEMTVGEFKAWLRQFDGDRDGRISVDELRRALHSLRTWFAWWKAREAMKLSDANRNRHIDGDEIGNLVIYAEQHLHMKINEY